jgi:hypothetical protein
MNKAKTMETILVITTVFIVIYWLSSLKVFLFLAITIGLIGILIPALAGLIAKGWFKVADALSFVMSRLILGLLYFLVLFPIAIIYRIGRKDKLQIKKAESTTWVIRNHNYNPEDLENVW